MVVWCFFFFVFFLMMALFQISCARRCHSKYSKFQNFKFSFLKSKIWNFWILKMCHTDMLYCNSQILKMTHISNSHKTPKILTFTNFFSSNSGVSWWDGDWKRPQKILSPPFQHPGARGGARAPALVVGYYLISTIREECPSSEMKTLTKY